MRNSNKIVLLVFAGLSLIVFGLWVAFESYLTSPTLDLILLVAWWAVIALSIVGITIAERNVKKAKDGLADAQKGYAQTSNK
jgi:lipopolysaccharide export LptBFGC system permease protein LptF